eukprot:4824376-Pyramimonas_sp.AAC.1
MHVLAFTAGTYSWKRFLLLDGAYADALWPTRGIVAGSTSATYEAKAFMLPSVLAGPNFEGASQGLHVGDLSLHSWRESTELCVGQLKSLAVFLACAPGH